MNLYEFEATRLHGDRWAVRPKGRLGTCGYSPYAWAVVYVNAHSEKEAMRKFYQSTEYAYAAKG